MFKRTVFHSCKDADLMWHRARSTMKIKVIQSNGWKIQFEEGSSHDLVDMVIPAETRRKMIKGHDDLVLEIEEIRCHPMK